MSYRPGPARTGPGLIAFALILLNQGFRYPVPMFVLPPHADAQVYLICISAAMLIIGLGKVGFGAGVGIVAMPVLIIAIPADQALGLLLPALILGDIIGISVHRSHFDWSLLRWMIPGAGVGIIGGYLVLGMLQDAGDEAFANVLSIAVGSICLLLIAFQGWRLTGQNVPTIPKHAITSFLIGAIECFVSSLTNSAGALITIYMLHQKLGKRQFVATMLAFFMVVNLLKLPAFVRQGVISMDTIRFLGVFALLVPVGAVAGAWLNKRVGQTPFTVVLYAVAAVSAVRMIVKVLS